MTLTKHFFFSVLNLPLILLIFIASCKQIGFSNPHSEQKVEALMNDYVEAWSNGDVNKIVEEIYEPPLTIRYQDSVIVLGDKGRLKKFLTQTFKNLEKSNYGYSIINDWESKTIDKDILSFKMNYTRFLKDGSIMGDADRQTSYLLKKNIDGEYRIKSLIPGTPIE